MEFKFKLGDLVRIKRGLIADSYYKTEDGSTLYCATEMVGYGGLCAKITKLEERCGHRNVHSHKKVMINIKSRQKRK